MNEMATLQRVYTDAKQIVNDDKFEEVPVLIRADIDYLVADIQKNKSLISVVTTSLLKKILEL